MAKERFSTQLEVELAARVRATVAGMQRTAGPGYTLTQFTTDAVAEHIRRLEHEFNDGEAWTDEHRLTPGRRVTGP